MISPPDLTPAGALSEVVFIHDYVQLVFGDQRLSVYNELSVATASSGSRSGEPGLAEALRSLIGQRAVSVAPPAGAILALSFGQGAVVLVVAKGSGVEAFEFAGRSGPIVVEHNDA